MASEIMKAVQYSAYGGGASALKHVTIPHPTPKKGELLVKVEASCVNPLDWKIQKGQLRPVLPPKFPFIPGCDVAGEVVSVGPGVTDFGPGEKVVGWTDMKTGGTLAEYAILQAKKTSKKPSGVTAVDGGCLPIAGLTALQALTDSGVNIDGSYKGNVLVTAGAGGVGLYAVQLAKLSGAHVTATAGERNIEILKGLGADEVLDYKTEEGTKLISPSGKKYDVVVNAGPGVKWAQMQPQLSPTGIVQELNPGPSIILNSVVKKITGSKQKRNIFGFSGTTRDLDFLLDLIAQGKLKTVLDSKHPLDKVEDAWAKSMEGHATGKIAVTMTEE
ncbi:unnamed protein product [Calypogeia fissa]